MGRGIDFSAINAEALAQLQGLLEQWLPGGRFDGHEYKTLNPHRADSRVGSFSINVHSGKWGDFATGDKGGDPVSLYAFLFHGDAQAAAANALAIELGMSPTASGNAEQIKTARKPALDVERSDVDSLYGQAINIIKESGRATVSYLQRALKVGYNRAARLIEEMERVGVVGPLQPDGSRKIFAPAPAQAAGKTPAASPAEKKERTPWRPLTPVPAGAGAYPVAHIKRGRPESFWEYRNAAGELLGVVYRFKTSDGGKEVLPCVFAENSNTGAREWRWLSFPDPRPLYGLHDWREGLPVLVVEGEKCRDAAHAMLGDAFNVVTWPGGGKAVHKADWRPLAGCKVIIWPDADAQRIKLTKAQKEAGADPAAQPLLPAQEQPGIAAAEKIAAILADLDTTVRIVDLEPPGALPDGWDIFDAIADGADAGKLKDFMRRNLRAPARAESAGEAPPPQGDTDDWRRRLHKIPRGGLVDCRENIFFILTNDPEWVGVIAFDEFAGRVVKLKDAPTGLPAGEWGPEDDFDLGVWLGEHYGLLIRSEATVIAGVQQAANKNKVHPVRDYLTGLPEWDRVERCDYWLSDCLGAERNEYTMLVGRLFLIGMVARIMRPGCMMQYMPVLEGPQGRGKSAALRILAGEWFADTPFKIGDKDAYMGLRGIWLYEIAELDSFNRSETTAVKAFITIQSDHYREPYQRRMVDVPRQTVFGGNTNQGEYLKDTTGNRRFWPVRTGKVFDLEKLKEWRPQLFAEALAYFERGDRWYPTREEERVLFRPQQEARELGDPWHESIARWLADPERRAMQAVTGLEILEGALGVKRDKIDGARSMTTRVGNVMARLGWGKRRQSSGMRLWEYTRPAPAQPAQPVEDSSDLPL